MTREEEFLKEKNFFRRNAHLIIKDMLELSSGRPSALVDEVLHCIFFLGWINQPRFLPEEIVTDHNMMNELKGRYPQPFVHYKCQLPRRSPISCVLDMIIQLHGQEGEGRIIDSLQRRILELKTDEARELICSTICVSQGVKTCPTSPRYYGVSMSTSGRNAGQIMVASSCLSNWDSYVAGAVMTYCPKNVKKTYFDGTIKLPENVRCQAFNISQRQEMLPCQSCANLFGFTENGPKQWPYGNCAEVECLSNLFKNDKEVRERARPSSPTCTDANRQKTKESVLKELKDCLRMLKFQWDGEFYTPQV